MSSNISPLVHESTAKGSSQAKRRGGLSSHFPIHFLGSFRGCWSVQVAAVVTIFQTSQDEEATMVNSKPQLNTSRSCVRRWTRCEFTGLLGGGGAQWVSTEYPTLEESPSEAEEMRENGP